MSSNRAGNHLVPSNSVHSGASRKKYVVLCLLCHIIIPRVAPLQPVPAVAEKVAARLTGVHRVNSFLTAAMTTETDVAKDEAMSESTAADEPDPIFADRFCEEAEISGVKFLHSAFPVWFRSDFALFFVQKLQTVLSLFPDGSGEC